jgi:hypothetical protein
MSPSDLKGVEDLHVAMLVYMSRNGHVISYILRLLLLYRPYGV